jgi:hypothetical protein
MAGMVETYGSDRGRIRQIPFGMYGGMCKMLTEKEAIEKCQEMWGHVASGECKDKVEVKHKYPELFFYFNSSYTHHCPLCQYVKDLIHSTPYVEHNGEGGLSCRRYCPLYKQFGHSCEQTPDWITKPKAFAKLIMKLEIPKC